MSATRPKQWAIRSAATWLLALLAVPQPAAAERPTVRAVTAFVKLDAARHEAQVREALVVLRKIRGNYEKAGYQVQTIRIALQPLGEYTRDLPREQALALFRSLQKLSRDEQFALALGPALHTPSASSGEADLLSAVLRENTALDASLTVADENGVRWPAVRVAARMMKVLAEQTPGGLGNFSFAAAALVPPRTPFFPAGYHAAAGREFAVALQSANVILAAIKPGGSLAGNAGAIEVAMTRELTAVENMAQAAEKETGWRYVGVDLSPAPLKDVSIGAVIEKLTGAKFGTAGTLSAAAMLTGVLRRVPVRQTGYSGLMLPVLEDSVLAQRWSEGLLEMDALLAYSAVCGTGLDTIPLPGDVTEVQLARIIGDVASLAVKLNKPLSVRLMPVKGKKAGERSAFDDPFIVNAVLQPLK
jgi:hypothetical protein